MSDSLFDKYGGFGSVSRVVMAFYDRLLDSDEIGDFFDDVDMKRLIDHQTKFVSSLMGGPASYTDERLEQLHAHLDISGPDFDEMKRLLEETLTEFSFEETDKEAVLAAIESRRSLIVS